MSAYRLPIGLAAAACALLAACPERGSDTVSSEANFSSGRLVRAEPLAKPLQGEGFVKLEPEETRLEFDNSFRDEMLITYTLLQQSGFAAGDYNNDGLIDIYMTGLDANNKLFRNDGGWKFTDVTEESGQDLGVAGKYCCGAVFADVTGDGDLDLLVGVRNGPDRLFVGDGKGNFRDETVRRGVAGGNYSTVQFSVADFNGDGALDIYAARYKDYFDNGFADLLDTFDQLVGRMGQSKEIPEDLKDRFYMDPYGKPKLRPHSDRLYLNDGNGNFTDVTAKAGLEMISFTNAAFAADFNDDTHIDLYISADFATPDRLFINNGDGTFRDECRERIRKTVLFGMGLDLGDMNGDGMLDMISGDMLARDGVQAKKQSGDMNQWRMELLYDKPQPQMRNMCYFNRGEGWFSEVGQMLGVAASDWTWSMRIADLNCDGRNDIITTTGMIRDLMDVDFAMEMVQLASREWDDPKEEIKYVKLMPSFMTQNHIFTRSNDDSLKFGLASGNWGITDKHMSCGMTLADFDNDGDPDVIISNTDDIISVYRNDFGGGERVVVQLRQGGKNVQGVGSRIWAYCGEQVFTQDIVLARGFATGEPAQVVLGLGEHNEIDRLVVRWPDGKVQEHQSLASGMLYTIERDRSAADWQPQRPVQFFNTSAVDWKQQEKDTQEMEFAVEPLLPFLQSYYGTGVAVADFDGNGTLDAYFCGASGQRGQLMLGDGKGGLSAAGEAVGLQERAEEMAALAFDSTGSGRPDLLLTSGGIENAPSDPNYRDGLFRNDKGTFTQVALTDGCQTDGAAAAADINGDGHLDLFIAGHLEPYAYGKPRPNRFLLSNGSGGFTDATINVGPQLALRSMITDAQFADMNGDGAPDLLIARKWGPVELWLNEGGRFSTVQELTPRGWWRGLGVGDFNNDGKLDVMAGNVGTNTKYSAKPGMPVTMYAADFDGNGSRDLVEVKFKSDGGAIPGRGRSCSGYAISYIPERFPTWTQFANATLEEVYGHKIPEAEKFEADELHSVVLLNEGDGKFAMHELPGAAQWTPAFGIAVGDYNADGNLDAYLAMNFTATQPETGAWNSGYGVLLEGRGDGTFRDVDVPEAGIRMYDDGRGAVPADLNGDGLLDLVISACNAAPQVALANPEKAAGSGLLVRLNGPSANTAGVGARLSLALDNGATLIREVQAGSGYLSSYHGPAHFGIPDGAQPAKLTVRWPDGKTTEVTEFDGKEISASYE